MSQRFSSTDKVKKWKASNFNANAGVLRQFRFTMRKNSHHLASISQSSPGQMAPENAKNAQKEPMQVGTELEYRENVTDPPFTP
jgi:hypothetical protein